MGVSAILAALDDEIASLRRARVLLTGEAVKRRPGRPANSFDFGANRPARKRTLSAEARARIAAAQRRRWAKQRKQQGAGK